MQHYTTIKKRHNWLSSEINFCIRLRKEGLKYEVIANMLTKEFGFPVSKSAVSSILLKHHVGSKKSSKNDTVKKIKYVDVPYENRAIGTPIDITMAGKNSCRYIIDDRLFCNAPIHKHDMCEYHYKKCYYNPEKNESKSKGGGNA